MRQRLSAKTIRNMPGPPPGRGYVVHYDADLPGFGLRITKAGARSLVLNYRARGVERRMTLASILDGATSEECDRTIAAARREAERHKSGAKYEGLDPMAARHEDRAKQTMADLAKRYLEEFAPKKRPTSQRDDKSMISGIILPAFRNRRVEDIRHEDIDQLHRKISKVTPVRANRVVALLSKMFALSIRWEWRKENPAKGVDRNDENSRKRYLEPDEIERLCQALAAAKPRSSANAVRLLMLTGARRGEVLSATWSQIDFKTGTWTKPRTNTKQKTDHIVPLNAPARLLFLQMRDEAEKSAAKTKRPVAVYIFPGNGESDGPQQDLKHFWATLCRDANIEGVRLHDLRHTFASVLANAGFTLPIIGALLGHTNPKTTARYAHLFDDPQRNAAERAGVLLSTPSQRSDQ